MRHDSRIALLAILALLIALTDSVASTARAATPASGTISPTNSSLAYTAGPFVVPVADTSLCDPSSAPCDTFSLTVATPAGFQATNNVKVVISWANRAADFDLRFLELAETERIQVGRSVVRHFLERWEGDEALGLRRGRAWTYAAGAALVVVFLLMLLLFRR